MAFLTKDKETILRLVLQTSSEAVLLLDSQGTILGASLALTGLLETEWQKLLGQPFSMVAPPELNDGLAGPPPEGKQQFTIMISSGEKIHSNWNVVGWTGDNQEGEEMLYAAYLTDWFGKPGTGFDSFLDDTIQEHLSDSLPVGLLVTDRSGKIRLYNSAQEKITGVSSRQALGKTMFSDYGIQSPAEVVEDFGRAINEVVENSEHEFDYTDRHGKTRRFRSRISSLVDPEEQIHGVVQTLEDISGRQELQQEINRTRGFLKRLLDTTVNPIFTADMKGRITFLNYAAEILLGLDSRRSQNITTGKLLLGGVREAVQIMQYLDECEGTVENYETYICDLKGKEVPVSLTLSFLYDLENKPEGMFGIIRNLERERKLESEIRINEHYLATFIQNSQDAVITLDDSSLIKTWNQGAETIFGYSAEEMVGQPLDRLLPAGIESGYDWHMGKVEFQRDGRLKHYITELVNRRGERLVVEATSTVLSDQYQGVRGRLIIFRDITLRARLEKILQENIANLSTINEISEALLTSKDLDEILGIILIGVTASQGLGFNRAFLLLADFPQNLLVGRLAIGPSNAEEAGRIWQEVHQKYHTLHELFEEYKTSGLARDGFVNEVVRKIRMPLSQKDNPLVRALEEKRSFNIVNGVHMGTFPEELARLLSTDTLAVVPIFCEHRSLGLLLADNLINHRPIDEEAVGRLRVFANLASQTIERLRLNNSLEEKISDLDKAYKDLKESRKKLIQVERLSALGQLAAHVAHEIRNPLVSIGGFARALSRETDKEDPRKEKIEIILEEAIRLERYLKDTLTLMRHNNPVFRPVDPNSLIQESLKMIEGDSGSAEVEVKLELLVNPPFVELDPEQIRQVLLNLFRNALEAMPGGGKLTVGSYLESNFFTIAISDTGVGIEDKNMENLFTAFFTTKSAGSGLGLSISSQIIRNHGGTIGLSSRKGEGTVFHVKLPVTQAANKESNHEEIADRR